MGRKTFYFSILHEFGKRRQNSRPVARAATRHGPSPRDGDGPEGQHCACAPSLLLTCARAAGGDSRLLGGGQVSPRARPCLTGTATAGAAVAIATTTRSLLSGEARPGAFTCASTAIAWSASTSGGKAAGRSCSAPGKTVGIGRRSVSLRERAGQAGRGC